MIRSLRLVLLGLAPVALAGACGDGEGTKSRVTRSTGGSGGTAMGEAGAPAAGRRAMSAAGGSAGIVAMGEAGASANANQAGAGGETERTGGAGGAGNPPQAGSPGSSGEAGDGSGGAAEPAGGTGGSAGRGGSPAAGTGGTAGSSTGALTACAHPYGNFCEEYFGPSEFVSDYDYNCSFSEQNTADACPEGFQGLCTVVQDVFTFRRFYYQLDADELAAAEGTCADNLGTWTVP